MYENVDSNVKYFNNLHLLLGAASDLDESMDILAAMEDYSTISTEELRLFIVTTQTVMKLLAKHSRLAAEENAELTDMLMKLNDKINAPQK